MTTDRENELDQRVEAVVVVLPSGTLITIDGATEADVVDGRLVVRRDGCVLAEFKPDAWGGYVLVTPGLARWRSDQVSDVLSRRLN